MACKCDWCKWYAEYKRHIELVPEESRKFFEAMGEQLLEVECDRDYYKAIVHNEWKNATDILRRYHKFDDAKQEQL